MSTEVESDRTHSYCCWPLTPSTFTCDRVRKIQDTVVGESTIVVGKIPEFIQFYCCFCCYRKRKSIGVTQENNNPTCNGTPIIPITIAPDV